MTLGEVVRIDYAHREIRFRTERLSYARSLSVGDDAGTPSPDVEPRALEAE